MNIRFCHCIILTYIPILTTEILPGKVQSRQTLKKIDSLQKYAIRIVYSKDILLHTTELFKECKVLNVYQVVLFLCIKLIQIIYNFFNKFKNPTHNCSTNFARNNYSIPPFKLNKSKYRISIRGPNLWKNIPTDTEKESLKP